MSHLGILPPCLKLLLLLLWEFGEACPEPQLARFGVLSPTRPFPQSLPVGRCWIFSIRMCLPGKNCFKPS